MKGLRKLLAVSLAVATVMCAASCDSVKEKDKDEPETEVSQEETEVSEEVKNPETSISEETEPSITPGGNTARRRVGVDEDDDMLLEISGGYKFTEDCTDYILNKDDPEIVSNGMICNVSGDEAALFEEYLETEFLAPFKEGDSKTLHIDDCILLTEFLRIRETQFDEPSTLTTDDDGNMKIVTESTYDFYHEELAILSYEDEETAAAAFEEYVTVNFGSVELSEDEYQFDGTQGYLVANFDFKNYLKYLWNKEATDETIEAYKAEIGEFIFVDAIYLSENKIIKLQYMNTIGSTDYCTVELIESKGFGNPFEVVNSEEFLEYYSAYGMKLV